MNAEYSCLPCDKIFTGEAPYKDHILSEKHKKKINSLEVSDSFQTTGNYQDLNLDEHIQQSGKNFKCTVCNAVMHDLLMATSHVRGQKHLKAISKLSSAGLINLSAGPDMELDSNIKKNGTEFTCTACNVFMNDISIVSSHLKGQKHLKTIAKMNYSVTFDLAASSSECSELGEKLDRFIEKKGTGYMCNACIVVMEDISVAVNHAKGPVHLKAVAEMGNSFDYNFNVALFNSASTGVNSPGSISQTSIMTVDSSSPSSIKRELDDYIEKKGLEYMCKVCKVYMNDISIVSSHLKGQKHMKTISKLGISNLAVGSPSNPDLEFKLDQNIEKKGLMYICNVCNATMNDISTATSHAKGQKHLKNVSKLKYSANFDSDVSLQSLDSSSSDSVMDSPEGFDNQEYKLDQFIQRCGTEYKCNACKVGMNDISCAASHVRGQKHAKSVLILNSSQSPVSSSVTRFNKSESSLGSSDSDSLVNENTLIGSNEITFNDNDSLKYDRCIEKLGNDYVCHACNAFMNTDSIVKSHLSGQKHLKNKLRYKGSKNATDDSKSHTPVASDDMYLFDKNFSFDIHTVDEVMMQVKVFNTGDPVVF